MTNNTQIRLLELDSLRGLAALAVVLYHYTTRYDELFTHKKITYINFSYGDMGVNLFFIISGFVIFMTLSRVDNVQVFIKRRMLRLYPAYIIAVIVTFSLVRMYDLENRGVSLGEAFINLTMLQGHLLVPAVDGAYWTLTVELTFYVIMGLVLYFGLYRQIATFSLVWLAVSASIIIINSITKQRLSNFIEYLSIANYSHLFIAGIMFYLIRVNGHAKYHLIILLCLLYEYTFMSLSSNIFITLFFTAFYFLIYGKLSFLKFKPLVYLGAISYSLYLIHQNIGYIIINIMEDFGLVNEVFLIIPISISIGLAILLTYYVEKPVQNYFRNKSRDISGLSKVKINKVQ